MHSHHPDVHTDGLADDCPGCAEIAEDPFANADMGVLRDLVALASRRDRHAAARSTTELIASTAILNALERAGKLAELAPAELEAYLRERWNIVCSIEGNPIIASAYPRT